MQYQKPTIEAQRELEGSLGDHAPRGSGKPVYEVP